MNNDRTFSGNPLDRSIGDRKDPEFLLTCCSSSSAVFYLHTCDGLLCWSSDDFVTLLKLSWSTLAQLLSQRDVESLIRLCNATAEVTLVVLGQQRHFDNGDQTSMRPWHIAVALHSRSLKEALEDKIRTSHILANNYGSGLPQFVNLRELALNVSLPLSEISIAGLVSSMANWHGNNKYNGKSGSLSVAIEGGMKRQCTQSKQRVYPRIDGVAIICVVSQDGQRCLLGRMGRHRPGFFSCLSGFVEPCESVQEAAIREVKEESGVVVDRVWLVDSQPWPLGRGGSTELMLGCMGVAKDERICVTEAEVEEVRWFTKDQVRMLLQQSAKKRSHESSRSEKVQTQPMGELVSIEGDIICVPGPYAIAHHLLQRFVDMEDTPIQVFSPTSISKAEIPSRSRAVSSFSSPDNSVSSCVSLNVISKEFWVGLAVGVIVAKAVAAVARS